MSRRKKSEPKKIFSDTATTDDSDVEFQEDNKPSKFPNDPEELLKYIEEFTIEGLYKHHELPRTYYIQKTKFERGEIDILVCDFCLKEFISAPGLNYHLMRSCPTRKKTRFSCNICEETRSSEIEITNHIRFAHLKNEAFGNEPRSRRKGIKRFVFNKDGEGANQDPKDDPRPAEEDDGDFDFIENDEVKRPREESKRSFNSKFANIDFVYEDFFYWTYEIQRVYESSLTEYLPDMLPKKDSFETSVAINEVEKCIRRFAKSAQFFVQREEDKRLVKPQTLSPLQSSCVKKTARRFDITFYVGGGAVWTMDWCPFLMTNAPRVQYLAIATHSNLHFFNTTYNESSIIQIWKCGKLQLRSHDLETPSMAIGFYHTYGPIWDLKWAPNGYMKSKYENCATRLGLLACASASGVVVVLSIPLPDDLKLPEQPEKDDNEFYDKTGARVFKVEPSMILHPGPNEDKEKNIYGQCLKVDWNKQKQSSWIAAGYSSGFVALWKVVVPSKLLTKINQGCQEIIACRVFRAHSKPVRALSWCPYDGDILATGGYDRFFKIWNINKTEWPQFDNADFNSSLYTDVVWPLHWCGVYAATDEVFAVKYFRGAIFINANDGASCVQPVLPFKSPCWSVTCSDWLNFVSAGDIMGNLCLFAGPNWNKPIMKTSKKCPRLLLYSVKEEKDEENSLTTLVFHDTNMTNLKGLPERKAYKDVKRYETFPDHSYSKPLNASINCVKWNANLGSHTWIASGLHCGLVRLHCIHSVHNICLDGQYSNVCENLPAPE